MVYVYAPLRLVRRRFFSLLPLLEVKRSISFLLQAVINLMRQHLRWKFSAEKLLGQILRLRLRTRAE